MIYKTPHRKLNIEQHDMYLVQYGDINKQKIEILRRVCFNGNAD